MNQKPNKKPEPYPCDDFWRAGVFEVKSKSKTWSMPGWESRCGVWRLINAPESKGQYILFLVPLDACFAIFDCHERAAALVEYADSMADFSKLREGEARGPDGNVKANTIIGVSIDILMNVGSYARYALGASVRFGK